MRSLYELAFDVCHRPKASDVTFPRTKERGMAPTAVCANSKTSGNHSSLVLTTSMRGRSTGCGRIYEDRFRMSCPPAST
jgi:hypothetical protein